MARPSRPSALALVLLGGLFPAAAAADAPSRSIAFAPAVVLAAGANPADVVAADLTGDSRTDLAISDNGSDAVVLLVGRGDGSFNPGVLVPAGREPTALAAADLNRDGRTDLAVTNPGANRVSVLLAREDGGFAPALPLSTAGKGPGDIAVGDLDGDGNPDLATADCASGDVSVILAHPGGGWRPAVTVPMPGGVVALTLADLDADGALDLAVGTLDSAAVRLGQGDGTFGDVVEYAPFGSPLGITTGDLDRDGDADVVIADYDGGPSIMRNRGTGWLDGPEIVPGGAGNGAVAVADIDGDGRVDAVATHVTTANGVLVVLGADGKLETAAEVPLPGESFAMAVGDLDGDDRPDVAALTAPFSGPVGLSVLLNRSGMSSH
jgi:hypothetical protein